MTEQIPAPASKTVHSPRGAAVWIQGFIAVFFFVLGCVLMRHYRRMR